MATTHYNFTELVGTNAINLVADVKKFLDEIDAALWTVSQGSATEAEVQALRTTVGQLQTAVTNIETQLATYSTGTTYNDLDGATFVKVVTS